MKPRIKRGKPIGQTEWLKPIAQYICDCPECSHFTAYDPTIYALVPGRICGRDQYINHQRRVRILQAATVSYNPPVDNDQCNSLLSELRMDSPPRVSSAMLGLPDHGLASDQPSENGVRRSARRVEESRVHKEKERERIRSTQDAADIYRLEDVSREGAAFKERMKQLCWDEVIFITPPSPYPTTAPPAHHSEINQGQYALEFARLANKPVLEYESWLVAAMVEVDGILAKERPVVLAKKKKTGADMRAELDRIEKLKETEWKRRHELQRRSRRALRSGQVDVIDTGACVPILVPRTH